MKLVEELKTGRNKHLSLVGPLNIGKSLIVKEFVSQVASSQKDVFPAFVDLGKIGLSPEDFAVEFISTVGSWYAKKNVNLDGCKFGKSTSEIVDKVKNELLKIKPDHRMLVELAFNYPETLGKEANKKVVLCVDEFWRVLDLDNFSQIGNIVQLFKSLIGTYSHTSFILTNSAVNLFKEINLSLGFETIEVTGLSLKDVGDEEVHFFSRGIPFYVQAIKSRMGKFSAKEAFIIETLCKSGLIYNACNFKLTESLSRARGKSLLFSILKALAFGKNEGLRLAEISKLIYRTPAVTKNLLSRLIHVDLVEKLGNRFVVADPVLRYWLKNVLAGNEFDFVPDKNVLRNIEVDI